MAPDPTVLIAVAEEGTTETQKNQKQRKVKIETRREREKMDQNHDDESNAGGNATLALAVTAGEEEEDDELEEEEVDNNNNNNNNNGNYNKRNMRRRRRARNIRKTSSSSVWGKTMIMMVSGSLVYYHCAYRESSLLSLLSDVFIVLLCSLAILGLLFRQMNIQVPVDPLEWQISQDSANTVFACLANTLGAAESVLRVAATGHDKRLFLKVFASLYILSALGRVVSGVTLAYAGLCLFCLYVLAENSPLISTRFFFRREDTDQVLHNTTTTTTTTTT